MPDIQISTPGILKLLANLKPNKAPGPDKIYPCILKELKNEIAPVLQIIFTKSLSTSKLPSEWLSANVAPIFKKGDKSAAINYRPISLTCICCKLMEHIVASNLTKHLEKHNILFPLQHGFRANRSCESQLLMFTDELARSLQENHQIDTILLDFSKAFDKVSHEKLILKLHSYGIHGSALSWIKSFLNNRTQKVILEGDESDIASVTSGVPQGSVLGPILFLTYINDLPEGVQSKVRLFADDTVVYLAITEPSQSSKLQEDLGRLEEWERTWDMSFNPSKCVVLRITGPRSRVMETTYTLHGTTLETVSHAKYLGVTLHEHLSWNTHISNITNTANRTLGMLRRNLWGSPQSIKSVAYQSLVRPQLEYASAVWDPHTAGAAHQLEMVQRRAARFVKRDYTRDSSVTAMLNELGWMTLAQRRVNSRLVIFYKIVHGLVAIPKEEYLIPLTRPTRHHHSNSFRIPYASKNSYKFSFFPCTIRRWNALPEHVAASPTLETFKEAVYHMHPPLP